MMTPQGRSREKQNRIPVSIVTGFLGSGKTTLINYLVNQDGMESTALIINEFGEIGLDHVLVESSFENTLLLENGCICCSIRGDLVDTICDLFAKVENGQLPPFTRIMVETTGIADPGPIAQDILTDEGVIHRCVLECIVVIVDGVLGLSQINRAPEVAIQIAQADIVLISKIDIGSPERVDRLQVEILAINPTAMIAVMENGEIDPDFLFQSFAATSGATSRPASKNAHSHGDVHHHGHPLTTAGSHAHGDIATISVVREAPIEEARLRPWLTMIYSLNPHAMLRMKGFVRLANHDRPLLLHGVGSVISPPVWLESWPEGKPETRLVFIFKELDADVVKKSFQKHVLDQPSKTV